MRVFGLKTEKVVHGYRCESGIAPPNGVKINASLIEVWIYGRTYCLDTETSRLVARR